MINLGVLGHGAIAAVDDRGAISSAGMAIDWWVGADDGWHVPAGPRVARQRRVGAAPVTETFVRVPGGEVVHRAYGTTTGAGAVVVIEVENASPQPLTIALVVDVAFPGTVEFDGPVMRVGGAAELVASASPRAWAAGPNLAETVMGGRAGTGPVAAQTAPTKIALLFPVAHRTGLRAAVGSPGDAVRVDARDLPSADAVARGWERQLERSMQAQLPAPIGELVDPARADLLLLPRHAPGVVSALEDWGFDDEAALGWAALGWGARRRARRRVRDADPWSAARAASARAEPARFLSALRDVLVREQSASVDLLPAFPPDWLGQAITVESLPLRSGPLSFAARWHGARPALLWDAPDGLELRAPALDSAWSANAPAGEALLAEPPTALLPMGSLERSAGAPVEAPGQFS